MKSLKNHVEQGTTLTSWVNEQLEKNTTFEPVTEGKIMDWVKSVFNWFGAWLRPIGEWFVSFANKDSGQVVPAVSPLNTIKAYSNGTVNKDTCCVTGLPSDKKYVSNGNYNYNKALGLPEYQNKPTLRYFQTKFIKNRRVSESIVEEQEDITWEERYNALLESGYNLDFDINEYIFEGDEVDLAKRGVNSKQNIDQKSFESFVRARLKNPSSRPICIWGAPGIGKTAIVKQVVATAAGDKKRLINISLANMRADDFTMPFIVRDPSDDNKVVGVEDLPKSWLPVYKVTGDPELDKVGNDTANAGNGGIIFIDEISRARDEVQNVLLKLVDERILNGYKLGDKWGIVCAANRLDDDDTDTMTWNPILGSRFFNVNFVPSSKDWLKWAEKQQMMSKEVLEYISFCDEFWYKYDRDEAADAGTFPNPRTWTNACEELYNMASAGDEEGWSLDSLSFDLIENILSGYVGGIAASKFMDYYRVTKSLDVKALAAVWKDGKKAPVPKKGAYDVLNASIMFVCSTMKKLPTPDEFMQFCIWLGRLDNPSMAQKAWSFLITKQHPQMRHMIGQPIDKENGVKDFDIYEPACIYLFDECYAGLMTTNYDELG